MDSRPISGQGNLLTHRSWQKVKKIAGFVFWLTVYL